MEGQAANLQNTDQSRFIPQMVVKAQVNGRDGANGCWNKSDSLVSQGSLWFFRHAWSNPSARCFSERVMTAVKPVR